MREFDKRRGLIPHWIEHNEEHARAVHQWAEHGGTAQADILLAAERMREVNEPLAEALGSLAYRWQLNITFTAMTMSITTAIAATR